MKGILIVLGRMTKTFTVGLCVVTVVVARVLLLLPTSVGGRVDDGWSDWPRSREPRNWFGG